MTEELLVQYINDIVYTKNLSIEEMNTIQAGIIQVLLTKITELKFDLEYKSSEEIGKVVDAADAKIASIGDITGGLTNADILDNLTSSLTNKALSANQGRVLKQLIDNLAAAGVTIQDNLLSTAANEALSANQGRVLKSLIEAITIPAIVNDLVQGGSTKTLSAEQGKILKSITDTINTAINNIINGTTKVGKASTADSATSATTATTATTAGSATSAGTATTAGQLTDQRTGAKKIWTGTEAQYTALSTKDSNTLYFCI